MKKLNGKKPFDAFLDAQPKDLPEHERTNRALYEWQKYAEEEERRAEADKRAREQSWDPWKKERGIDKPWEPWMGDRPDIR